VLLGWTDLGLLIPNISLVSVLIDISNFFISGGILFKMLVLGINEMVFGIPLKF
jgi:hypothetical protein